MEPSSPSTPHRPCEGRERGKRRRARRRQPASRCGGWCHGPCRCQKVSYALRSFGKWWSSLPTPVVEPASIVGAVRACRRQRVRLQRAATGDVGVRGGGVGATKRQFRECLGRGCGILTCECDRCQRFVRSSAHGASASSASMTEKVVVQSSSTICLTLVSLSIYVAFSNTDRRSYSLTLSGDIQRPKTWICASDAPATLRAEAMPTRHE